MFQRVKRIIIIVSLLLMGGYVFNIVAQYPHYVVVWGGGGYASLMNNVSDIRSLGGAGFELGMGYEWRHKKLVLHTGIEYQGTGPKWSMDDFEREFDEVDSENDPYTARYYFKRNKEKLSLGYVNIPLMAGMQFKRFYFLGGAKVGINVLSESRMENLTISTGDYDQFIEEFTDMPNHGFDRFGVRNNYPLTLGLNCALAAELGYSFKIGDNPKSPMSYRLAFFFDYGLLNLSDNRYDEELVMHQKGKQPVLNSFLRSADNLAVHPLSVGLKFTVLWGIEGKRNCRCEW